MSISPWLQGTRDTISVTVSPLPASFVNPSMIIHDRTGYAADITATGLFGAINLTTGVVTFTPSAADVGTPGDYTLFLKYFDNNGIPYLRQIGEWLVIPV